MNHTSRGPVENVMKMKTVSLLMITVTLLVLQGCSSFSSSTDHAITRSRIPAGNPMLE